MAKVGILSLDNQDLHTDARVQRQIRYLAKKYEVYVISYGKKDIPVNLPAKSIEIVGSLSEGRWKRILSTVLLLSLGRMFGTWFYEKWYWQRPGHTEAYLSFKDIQLDFIQANDWWTMPVAVWAAQENGAKVIIDFHEYAPEEYSELWWRIIYRPMVHYFICKYRSSICGAITVNQMIADRYVRDFQIEPIVVMNAPEIISQLIEKPFDPLQIKLVHHGYALRSRQLEKMIDVIARCDQRYSLTYILVGDQKYIEWLKRYAQRVAPGRVIFMPGVKPNQLNALLCQFDMGIYLSMDSHFSYLASLPNKFFEFISAGLAVCIGPSPAMAELVDQYQFGVQAVTFQANDVAQVLNRLTADEFLIMKQKAREARKFLNAEVELEKLLNLYTCLERSANLHSDHSGEVLG
jgi:glycosyltransferase involved in cell wall biosynthesis